MSQCQSNRPLRLPTNSCHRRVRTGPVLSPVLQSVVKIFYIRGARFENADEKGRCERAVRAALPIIQGKKRDVVVAVGIRYAVLFL